MNVGQDGTMLAILNPAAGGGRCGRMAAGAIKRLRDAGLSIDVWYTREAGDGIRLGREGLAKGYRDFVAVGGDGTSYEVVNGISDAFGIAGERVSLGFLPLGTGNSFIRDFTKNGVEDAPLALTTGRRRACDVVRVEHDDGHLHFINIFSYGFVADVCEQANARFKRFGSAGYAVGVAAELSRLRFPTVDLTLDEHPAWQQSAAFVSINNSQYTGGSMQMAPFADTADGKVDVLVVGELGRATFLSLFARIFKGQHIHHPAVTTAQAERVAFAFDAPQPMMVDGEVVTLRPTSLRVLPGALDVRI